jgi:hypothetical protein
MTRRDDLIALRDAVKAGEWARRSIVLECFPHDPQAAMSAYRGSLDAAKALHEATLPGWGWAIDWDGGVFVSDDDITRHAHSPHPARAWLLAIIEALIAQEAAE